MIPVVAVRNLAQQTGIVMVGWNVAFYQQILLRNKEW